LYSFEEPELNAAKGLIDTRLRLRSIDAVDQAQQDEG
jgi:hypothetical protein